MTTLIRVENDADRGRARVEAHGTTLRPMLLGSDATSARVALVAEGALLLGGDRVAIDVEVGVDTTLVIVEPSGTVAYDMRGGSAHWGVRIKLGRGATLVWHCAPFVISQGADVRRTVTVDLADAARLLQREQLVLGRTAEGPGRFRSTLRIRDEHGPLLAEDLDLGAHSAVTGVLGANRVLETVTAIGAAPTDADADARMVLDRNGAIWRRLSAAAHTSSLAAVWTCLVDELETPA